jgi:hypothetical protein
MCAAHLWVVPAQAQPSSAQAEARRHFERGVELFTESRYPEARIEFEASYRLVPNHRVLFNIGNVHAAEGHAVEAVDAYERYLAQGGASIDRARREQVEAALATQRTRIGTLLVTSNVEGAAVTIDGVNTERTTPLTEPMRLSIGEYAIGLHLAGHQGPTRRVTIAGESHQTIELEMTRIAPQRGTLRISASAPNVEVLVDGEVVGSTPFDAEVVVPSGEREVVGRRAGYLTSRERVVVTDGASADVALRMERDPSARPQDLGRLVLELPSAPTVVRVDGEEVARGGGEVALPVGAHRLSVQVDERRPFETDIDIPPEGTVELAPALVWTPEAKNERLVGASTQRTIGLVVGGIGVAALLAGAALVIWIAATDDRAELLPDFITCTMTGMICNTEMARNATRYQDLERIVPLYYAAGIPIFAAGAIATGIGLYLLLGADSEEAIDAGARAGVSVQLLPSPTGATLVGSF